MNIAIFGGSFDPPHLGHQEIIVQALQTLPIDKLIVIPTFLNPFKTTSSLDAKDRYKLMQLLCEDLDKVEISDIEIIQNKQIATIDTIKYLKNSYPTNTNFYLIIGADNLQSLHLWKDYKQLKKMVTFVVATRDNIKIDNFLTLNVNFNISSTKIRENFDITLIPNKIKQKVKTLWKIE